MKTLADYLRTSLSEKLLMWSWRIAPARINDTAILRRHLNNYFAEVMANDGP